MATYSVQLTVEGRDIRQIQKQYPGATVEKKGRSQSRADRFSDAVSLVVDAKSEFEALSEELRSWYENLPENFQEGEKGQQLEEAADALDEAVSQCEEVEGADVNFPGMY